MRIFALLISLCALSQAAIAQTPECKSITNSNDRLACYDKAAPPIVRPVAVKGAPAKSQGSKEASTDGSQYVDEISAEDARVSAKLKGICHGC